MSSFKFFFLWVAFCFAKNRLFRVPLSLHSFATLRNWLRQPLQSLPLFKIKKLKIEPKNKYDDKAQINITESGNYKKLFLLIFFWKQFLMKKLAAMAENLFLLQFIMPGFTKVNLSAKLSGKFWTMSFLL